MTGNHFFTEIEKLHRRHMETEKGVARFERDAILIRNQSTDRELKVIVCRPYCIDCMRYVRALLWNRGSPLHRLQKEMPLIADRPKTPAPS